MSKVRVHRNRTNVIVADLGIDVSGEVITSQIRSKRDVTSTLIMEWDIAFETDGTDGRLVLTVDNLITEQIEVNSGYMDFKRMSGGEPLAVFDEPLEVEFVGAVTA